MALPASDRDLASEQSSLHYLPISFSDLFLACIPRKRTGRGHGKKVRFAGRGQGSPKSTSSNPFSLGATTNEKSQRCSHVSIPPTRCTCSSPPRPTSTLSANTLTPSSDNQPTPYLDPTPILDPTSTSIIETTTTSIRIVPSDTSSDYNSFSSLTSSSSIDGYLISDYECRCGGSGAESMSDYDCTCSCDEFNYGYCYGEEKDEDRQVTGSMRPLPPLPGSNAQRKGEIKTRLIEETIREEDEDEYLAQQASEQQKVEQDEKKKEVKPRRKSMIELLHLASLSSSTSPDSGSRPASPSSGLLLSFSNLHFRFPLPPFSTHTKSISKEIEKDTKNKKDEKQTDTETQAKIERKRPMSMSALVIPSGDLDLNSSSNLGLVENRHTVSITAPSPLTLNPVSRDDFLEGNTFPLMSTSTSSSNEKSQSQTSLDMDIDSAPSPNIRLALSNTSSPSREVAATGSPMKSPSPNTRRERRMGTILFLPSPLAMLSRSNIRDSNGSIHSIGNMGRDNSVHCKSHTQSPFC
ncbi:hypothetical protein BDV19DRAFT_394515 [Aspergillus venezuelensis]